MHGVGAGMDFLLRFELIEEEVGLQSSLGTVA